MKIKFIVDKISEDGKIGTVSTSSHFYGNLNKMLGVWDILKSELDSLPPNSSLNNVLPMYKFTGCVLLNNHSKNVRMILLDADNDEDKAKHYADSFGAKDTEMGKSIMKVFYQIRDEYEEVKDRAELSLVKSD